MYKSPITVHTGGVKFNGLMEKIEKELSDHIDEAIIRATMEVHVEVDRDELIRALAYDRGQYQKGYSDGWEAAGQSIVRCRECKHFYQFFDKDYCRVFEELMAPDDYCSHGERKEERDGQADE